MVVLVVRFSLSDISVARCFSSPSLVLDGKGWESLDTERISVWERNHYSVSLDLQVDLQAGALENFPGKGFVFGSE